MGNVCQLSNWLFKVKLQNGMTILTHGADPPPPKPLTALPAAAARAPICQSANPNGNYGVLVVIAAPYDVTPNMSDAKLRGLIGTMDGVLYSSAVESGSASGADYVFACNSSGDILIDHETLPTPASGANFSTIVSDLWAKGYNNPNQKYAIWYDDGGRFAQSSGYCGQGSIQSDETASASNLNDSGPSYSITYDDDVYNCGYWTIMH